MYIYVGSWFGLMQLDIESSPEGVLTGVAVTCEYTIKISGDIGQNKKVRIRLDFDRDYGRKVLTGRLDTEKGIIKGHWGDWAENEDSEEEKEENSRQQILKDVEEAGSSAQQDEHNAIDSGTTNFESPSNPVNAGFQVSSKDCTFVFRRTPAPLWRFLPSLPPDSPVAVENLAHARWSFALKCVLDRIRRENSPGEYFVERFVEAGRFIVLARRELYKDNDYCPRLSDLSTEEEEELERLKCAICPEFIRPYYALVTDAIVRQTYM